METLTPFTPEEHSAFLAALERFGDGNSGREWQHIASAVGTRLPQEVMLHAHQYFLRLQSMAHNEDATMAIDDGNWTFEEETVFENGMATFDEDDPDRWTKIASLLPEKTPEDVRRRYQKLMYDITRIESGAQVSLEYKVKHRPGGAGLGSLPRNKMNGTVAAAALAAVVASEMEDTAEEASSGEAGRSAALSRAKDVDMQQPAPPQQLAPGQQQMQVPLQQQQATSEEQASADAPMATAEQHTQAQLLPPPPSQEEQLQLAQQQRQQLESQEQAGSGDTAVAAGTGAVAMEVLGEGAAGATASLEASGTELQPMDMDMGDAVVAPAAGVSNARDAGAQQGMPPANPQAPVPM